MRPHHGADDADRHHGIHHTEIAEDRFSAEGGNHVADNTEARQNHDIDLGVAEEPEQMLEQHGIATTGRVEE